MDSTDEAIIGILKDNGRASYTDIAEEVGISEGTVRNRVEKLKDDGVIERFTVEVSSEKMMEAFVMVNISTGADIDAIIERLPTNTDVYELAGDCDMMLKLAGETSSEINDSVDAVRAIEGVTSTKTYVVLSKNG